MAKNPNFEDLLLNQRNFDRYSRKGFAGLISDTSLLDIETVFNDGTFAAGADRVFRAGTVAVVTGVTKSGNRAARPAKPADAKGADTVLRFVAIAFSHDNTDQLSEVNPVMGGVNRPRPANGVNTGRIWMLLSGDLSTAKLGGSVAVAATPADGATNPLVNAAVTAAAADNTNAIPGWSFTGLTDYDSATGYGIAEVEVNRD